jgi:antitoxin (DNA-binding transcriptional repressor) of toxin-antitoxin stability system
MVMKANVAKTIAVGKAKTHLLALVSEVESKGTTHVITKRGKVVAHLVPPPEKSARFRPLWGRSKGSMKILGDIISPAVPEEEWDVLAE